MFLRQTMTRRDFIAEFAAAAATTTAGYPETLNPVSLSVGNCIMYLLRFLPVNCFFLFV